MSDPVFTNAFKQGVVGTYSNTDTVFTLDSISNTPGDPDYLADPASGEYYLVLYDGLYGNPADSNNNGAYEVWRAEAVNYGANQVTVARAQQNTTAQTLGARDWQVVFSATSALWDQKADLAGNASQTFNVDTATADEHAVRKEQLDSAVINEFDIWVLTTSFSSSSDPITTNLARSTVNGFSVKGSGMSQSSGIFTFPQTGYYEVQFTSIHVLSNDVSDRLISAAIQLTLNNSTYNTVAGGRASLFQNASQVVSGAYTSTGVNVTDTANQKVRFAVTTNSANTSTAGSTTQHFTHMVFKRLGDSV